MFPSILYVERIHLWPMPPVQSMEPGLVGWVLPRFMLGSSLVRMWEAEVRMAAAHLQSCRCIFDSGYTVWAMQ